MTLAALNRMHVINGAILSDDFFSKLRSFKPVLLSSMAQLITQ